MNSCKYWQASFKLHNRTPVVKEQPQMICVHPGQLSGKCVKGEDKNCPLVDTPVNNLRRGIYMTDLNQEVI